MARQPRSLVGKVVVITGGGRGIGRATARALAAKGARVAIADVDGASASDAAAEIGGGAMGAALDVTDRPAFAAFLDDVEQRLGGLDVLINNAGIMPIGPLLEEDDATVTRQLELNLHAVIFGTKEAVRRMRPRGTGHIVNLGSIAGNSPLPGAATYCATKFAVVGFSEVVRLELRGSGVDISVINPGHVRTELTAGVQENGSIKPVTAEEVADAIVATLEVPRFEVWVPRPLGPVVRLGRVLPRPVTDAVGRVLKADRALLEYDRSARAAYEARAAASAPAADQIADDERPHAAV
jgi:NAD(P)-dependent dehydrogenase (short-subunit alcohol dehydrogenase family)